MDKQRKRLIISAGFVLVFIIVWVNTFKLIRKRSRPKQYAPGISASVALPGRGGQSSAARNKPIVDLARDDGSSWGRCPFSGKVFYGETKALDLKLKGIFWDDDNPQAIINDQIWGEGQQVGKFEIIEILPEEVIVSDGSAKFELKIY